MVNRQLLGSLKHQLQVLKHLLWAPYAPKDTAAAPESPANLTNGDPWITKLLKFTRMI